MASGRRVKPNAAIGSATRSRIVARFTQVPSAHDFTFNRFPK